MAGTLRLLKLIGRLIKIRVFVDMHMHKRVHELLQSTYLISVKTIVEPIFLQNSLKMRRILSRWSANLLEQFPKLGRLRLKHKIIVTHLNWLGTFYMKILRQKASAILFFPGFRFPGMLHSHKDQNLHEEDNSHKKVLVL